MAEKRTSKKAAAKKTTAPEPAPNSGQEVEVAPVETPQEEVDLLGHFPLPQGHYFHPPVVSAAAHSGTTPGDRDAIRAMQLRIGVSQTGVFDEPTVEAVRAWKVSQGLDSSPVIDADAWERLRGRS